MAKNNFVVANCSYEFNFKCPKKWSSLSTTEDENVKFCDTCNKDVYKCNSKEELDSNISNGRCIAILDATASKYDDSDDEMLMGAVLPYSDSWWSRVMEKIKSIYKSYK